MSNSIEIDNIGKASTWYLEIKDQEDKLKFEK
jgi:hypothetical protein